MSPCALDARACTGDLPKILSGRVVILWDMENCPVPSETNAEDVAGNIRAALRLHPAVEGSVAMFSAYGDFNHFPRRLREGCQRTGVNLIDVPNGRKDAADKAILVDMFLFALDNPPPCTIFLISGDVDFAPALHKLGQRGYNVVLAVPAGLGVSSALSSAGLYVWDWTALARGEGLVSSMVIVTRTGSTGDDRQAVNSSSSSDDSDSSWRDHSGACPNDPVVQCAPSESPLFARPGDITGLKDQLSKLLALNGGKLVFVRVPSEYAKLYGKPLYLADYGAAKLAHLIERMSDAFSIKGEGKKRMLVPKNGVHICACNNLKINQFVRCDVNVEHDNGLEATARHVQEGDDEYVESIVYKQKSYKERTSKDEVLKDMKSEQAQMQRIQVTECPSLDAYLAEAKLEVFKQELQELLVSHACKILMGNFLLLYEQRYSRELDITAFGANGLELLIAKVQDVAMVEEEPGTKRKLLVASRAFG